MTFRRSRRSRNPAAVHSIPALAQQRPGCGKLLAAQDEAEPSGSARGRGEGRGRRLEDTPALSEEALPKRGPAEDPVRLYLKEIGKVHCWTPSRNILVAGSKRVDPAPPGAGGHSIATNAAACPVDGSGTPGLSSRGHRVARGGEPKPDETSLCCCLHPHPAVERESATAGAAPRQAPREDHARELPQVDRAEPGANSARRRKAPAEARARGRLVGDVRARRTHCRAPDAQGHPPLESEIGWARSPSRPRFTRSKGTTASCARPSAS